VSASQLLNQLKGSFSIDWLGEMRIESGVERAFAIVVTLPLQESRSEQEIQ
jgi:hypothetical protein